jgi:NAD(P)-dependent dehydrogenase (short-subunit alcohol dehydrogenase family)
MDAMVNNVSRSGRMSKERLQRKEQHMSNSLQGKVAEQGTTPEYREMARKRLIPLGRWCTPDDIAGAVIYFASDRGDMVAGQVLDVDGGAMTGYGEDMRPIIRQRMADEEADARGHA